MSEVKPVAWATALALLGVKNAEDGRRPRVVLLSRECAGGRRIGLILDADHERVVAELRYRLETANAYGQQCDEGIRRLQARVAELEREVAAKQARIDALMIEYCPDEMTPEQVAEWARHQRPISEQAAAAIDAARQQENRGGMADDRLSLQPGTA